MINTWYIVGCFAIVTGAAAGSGQALHRYLPAGGQGFGYSHTVLTLLVNCTSKRQRVNCFDITKFKQLVA